MWKRIISELLGGCLGLGGPVVKPKNATIGLAINSANVRDQDQLHIHLACLTDEASNALKGAEGKNVTQHWQYARVSLKPQTNLLYDAISLPDLSGHNPFSGTLSGTRRFSALPGGWQIRPSW